MRLFRSFTVVIILSTFLSAACGKSSVETSTTSSAGALTANSALNAAPKRFARHSWNTGGSNYLNEFILPDVRSRLDEEPVGDTDGGYDSSAASDVIVPLEESQSEPVGEGQPEDVQQQQISSDDAAMGTTRLDTIKYSWARKNFGDAVNASPTNNGVIVLYADEHYYDVERLMAFVEGGRNRIAEMSGIGGERIQVVFGGYRALPQVELWVVPEGGPMPEFKADDRPMTEQAN
jgi:hypothetical protein